MGKRIIAAGLVALLTGPALAQAPEPAGALQVETATPTPLAEAQAGALKGDPVAQFRLGQIYESGHGAPLNLNTAYMWYRKAAGAGHVEAQRRVAEGYETGRGLPQSYRDAFEWYRRAGDKGDVHALGKVGAMMVQGRGRRMNVIDGIAILEKAAGAGDGDAQAMLDDLAAAGRYQPAIGETEPTDPAARQALAEIRGLIEPLLSGSGFKLTVGGTPGVATFGKRYVVTLPRMEAVGPVMSIRLGTVRFAFEPAAEGDWAVQVMLPRTSTLVDAKGNKLAKLTLGSQNYSGRWSASLHTLLDYKARFTNVKIEGAARVVIGEVTAERVLQASGARYDYGETWEARDVLVGGGASMPRLAIASLHGRSTAKALDLAGYARLAASFGFDWRTGAAIAPVADTASTAGAALVKDVSANFGIAGLAVKDGAGALLGGVEQVEVSVGGKGLDEALAALSLHYAHDRLAVPAAGVADLPTRVNSTVVVDNIPAAVMMQGLVEAVAGVIAAGDPARARAAAERMGGDLVGTVLEAGPLLRLEEMRLAGSGYELVATGQLRPIKDGASGGLDIRVRGFDKLARLTSLGGGLAGKDVERWRKVARQETDPAGNPVTAFRVEFQPDGRILVNGKDASTL